MRFAVIGVGGVGGPFGAALAEAGYDVTFIARGDHLAAMQANGLRVEGEHARHVKSVQATDDPASVGPVDVVLYAVKLGAVESAATLLPSLIGPDTAVLSLQNGVDAEERLEKVIGPGHVMGGVAEIFAAIETPGVIRQVSPFARIRFGELDGSESARAVALREAFEKAGIECELSTQIERTVWMKFLGLATMSGMTSVTRVTVGELREEPETLTMIRAGIAEVVAVGRAKGVDLSEQDVDDVVDRVGMMPGGGRASMAVDLERGNPLELPWLSGLVVSMGRQYGVPTPVHSFINGVLKFYENGARNNA
jgi:2-dehydropantoate 2-reductase